MTVLVRVVVVTVAGDERWDGRQFDASAARVAGTGQDVRLAVDQRRGVVLFLAVENAEAAIYRNGYRLLSDAPF